MIIQKDLQGNYISEYPTKAAAARAVGIDEASIRRSIKFGRKVFGKFRYYNSDVVSENTVTNKSKAKILVLDIETAPIRAYTWGLWQQNVYIDQIISNWFMLTYSCKWLGSNSVMSDRLTGEEVLNEDDSRLIKGLWKLMDEADIVVAHNGNSFDIPKINSRFLVNGLNPPSPYKQVDTKIIARNQFGFSSNKLEALARLFGFDGKYDTDFDLWARCMKGDEEALAYMEDYNCQDVIVLEEVYLKLRPFAKGHPNLDLYTDDAEPSCPHCGSKNIELIKDKFFYTQSVKYETYRCECGAISRSKTGLKFDNKKQVSAIPR